MNSQRENNGSRTTSIVSTSVAKVKSNRGEDKSKLGMLAIAIGERV
jgi:hypothetical protein